MLQDEPDNVKRGTTRTKSPAELRSGRAGADGRAPIRRDRSTRSASVPSQMWRMLAETSATKQKLPKGLDAIWNAAAGRALLLVPRQQSYLRRTDAILAHDAHYSGRTDGQLRDDAQHLRAAFRLGRETSEDIEHAFAMVREIALRAIGLKPYPEQIAAALAMHDGCIAEMVTGEGKTLAATMPAVLAGWRGRGCHVLTVNDYLAGRDDRTMGPIYKFCGLSVSHIDQEMTPPDRRTAYLADITYCTNKEVAADFLRDRLALGRVQRLSSALLAKMVDGRGFGTDRLLQRGLHTAIVDEADSILVDEAVTPLIISGDAPNVDQVEAYRQAAGLAAEMLAGLDYEIDQRYREVNLTKSGQEKLARLAGDLRGFWTGRRRREELVCQAINARDLFVQEKQYVIQDDKIVIVDEFTGRLMPDRTWRAGLHQAIEAKEGLEVNTPKETLARISFQRFFRQYRHLSGMTGTAWEARHEFWEIYGMKTVVLPTHRPCIRIQEKDRIYAKSDDKWEAIREEVRKIHALKRPLLIGTRSVGASERLSRLLTDDGLSHQVLNAVRHAEEAAIIADAGQMGRITVATNMAGRGTDIKLGQGVADAGGLHVIATERHESGRVDRQLAGRAGRQGDAGSSVTFVSLEDELFKRYAPKATRRYTARFAHQGGPIDAAPVRGLYSLAQTRAEWVALRQRKGVLRNDDWLDEFLGFAGRES